MSPFFIVLKKEIETFNPKVQETLFNTQNIFVTALISGELTLNHVKTWLKEVFFPFVGPQSVLLLDLWSRHCTDIITELKSNFVTDIVLQTIPADTTRKIQLLDIYGLF